LQQKIRDEKKEKERLRQQKIRDEKKEKERLRQQKIRDEQKEKAKNDIKLKEAMRKKKKLRGGMPLSFWFCLFL
jgi:citrate lyase alpha subunit